MRMVLNAMLVPTTRPAACGFDVAPHVTLSKIGPATVAPSGSMTYTINLGNSGTSATGTTLVIADQLPAGVSATAVTAGTNVAAVDCGTMPSATGALLACTVTLTAPMAVSSPNGTSKFTITATAPASGSITKSRDVNYQAVFSLRGKPLNCFGLTRKVVYENEEFNLLQHALNIEEDMEELRYNHIILATDADVDGMHIRLLMITFFLQFFPDLIRRGHLHILTTPLFRVRNKKETFYCYSDEEKLKAMQKCGKNPEITRFKGLGEISPDEFKHFIGPKMRLEPVLMPEHRNIKDLLTFYMGKNTPDRQEYIVNNLRVERDILPEEPDGGESLAA